MLPLPGSSDRGRIASSPLPPPDSYGGRYAAAGPTTGCTDRCGGGACRLALPAAMALGAPTVHGACVALISSQACWSRRSSSELSSSTSTRSRFSPAVPKVDLATVFEYIDAVESDSTYRHHFVVHDSRLQPMPESSIPSRP